METRNATGGAEDDVLPHDPRFQVPANDPFAGWDALYLKYRRDVLRLCRKYIAEPGTAEDLMQETFLRALQHPRDVAETGNAWPWLSRIARNLCIDHLRCPSRTSLTFAEVLTSSAECGDVEPRDALGRSTDLSDETFETVAALQERAELGRRLKDAFASLTPRQRRVTLLRLEDGWSCEEVARAEGMNVKTVKNVTWRARTLLRCAWDAQKSRPGVLGWVVMGYVSIRATMDRLRVRATQFSSGGLDNTGAVLSERLATVILWGAAAVSTLVLGVGPATPAQAATRVVSRAAAPAASRSVQTRDAFRSPDAGLGNSPVSRQTVNVVTPGAAARGSIAASPTRREAAAPAQGTLTVSVDGPNRTVWSSKTGWKCGEAEPHIVPKGSPLRLVC
jgi:RNA polymerase sigma-70 factor, ECF subfamily